jgi:uncharacterized glyoxalase superfamily protein PhnB
MKPAPPGWPRMSSCLYYDDPRAAIDWLCKAFGFEVKIKVEGENGDIVHSELTYGDGLIMVGGTKRNDPGKAEWQNKQASPRSLSGANTQSICVYVDDADAHCAQARAAGAEIASEPSTSNHGEEYWTDRGYGARDLEGHYWWFMQRLRTGSKGT